MNKILKKTDDIIDVITNSEKYKKYIYLKDKMSEDKEIMELIYEVKSLQKKIINESYNDRDTALFEKEIYKNIELLNNYPIYVEFNYLQEDLNEVFQFIKLKIENNINDILN